MPGRSLWAVVLPADDTLPCFLARGAEIRPAAPGPAAGGQGRCSNLEVFAADIPFATGSFAVFQGMLDQADDTWPALGRQA